MSTTRARRLRGNDDLILAAASRQRLADLDYDYPALQTLMNQEGWTTVLLFWAETQALFHARSPFPPRRCRGGSGYRRRRLRRLPPGTRAAVSAPRPPCYRGTTWVRPAGSWST